MRYLALALPLLAAPIAHAYDVKGLTLNTTLEEYAKNEAFAGQCTVDGPTDMDNYKTCTAYNSYAGVNGEWIAKFYDNKLLDYLAFYGPTAEQAKVLDGLVSKYGKPTRREPLTLQNAYGATFKRESAVWRKKGFTISLTPITTDKFAVSFESDRMRDRDAKAKAANKKDM